MNKKAGEDVKQAKKAKYIDRGWGGWAMAGGHCA